MQGRTEVPEGQGTKLVSLRLPALEASFLALWMGSSGSLGAPAYPQPGSAGECVVITGVRPF